MTYKILMDKKTVGTAQIIRVGLYYNIICQCKISGTKMVRIIMENESKTVDLGVCVPGENCFEIRTKIPAKQIEGDKFLFLAVENQKNKTVEFFPVSEEEPFIYLEKLKSAKVQIRSGEIGVTFQDL